MEREYVALKAEMFNYDCWVHDVNEKSLIPDLERCLKMSGFTIVNFIDHTFPIQGYTCVWLLAESHLAIHTFPDQKKAFIQISSCNNDKLTRFKDLLQTDFSIVSNHNQA